MAERALFAQIIVPVPVRGTFTYEVPISLADSASVGQSVVVEFGAKKLYTGIIQSISATPPDGFKIKSIQSIANLQPIVTQTQLDFWQWVANYYMCPIGDVYKAAVPVGLRPDSDTKILPIVSDNIDIEQLSNAEKNVYSALIKDEESSVSQLAKETGEKSILNIVKSLSDKGFAIITEEIKSGSRLRRQKVLRLSEMITDTEMLNRKLALLSRGVDKQRQVLSWITNYLGDAAFSGKTVLHKVVLDKVPTTPTVIRTLVKNGFLIEDFEDPLQQSETSECKPINQLNQYQQEALEQIKKHFETQQTVLLHGITGSGKTEIYIHLIQETLAAGKRVLYMLPEIALTSQIVQRLKQFFGNKVGVYHSKYSSSERCELWNRQLNDEQAYPIILGVRSSIFLPYSNLGLIIIDEEHESSFKQYDPSPRYNARDLSIVLGLQLNAKVLLGSATPSLESYYNAQQGRYGLVNLNHRHGTAVLPDIVIVDTKKERRRKLMQQCFSQTLLSSIDAALTAGEQVILFQNRRGYSPFLECVQCGYVPKCEHCDVSLTYHKSINRLVCHYCGYTMHIPNVCPHCGNTMQMAGFGTERIEDELKMIFPQAEIARLDTDTTRSKQGAGNIIRDFQEQKTNILIGTQMVSKGLDFEHVSIVGIINADNMLSYPDFRAFERSYQLMAQVSGRAGRKEKKGTVIIQTANPENVVIQQVMNNNYLGMYQSQMAERQQFFYPPTSRLISITLKHRNRQTVENGATALFEQIQKIDGLSALGPTVPAINRIQNFYLMNILIKLSKVDGMQAKRRMQDAIEQFLQQPEFKNTFIVADVDPM